MNKTERWFPVLLALLLALTGCAAGGSEAPELLEPVGMKANTVSVERGEIYDMEYFTFFVAPRKQEVLHEADGSIAELCVLYGQEVKKGDVLLRLDVDEAQEQLERLHDNITYKQKDNALTLDMLRWDLKICAYEMNEARSYGYGTRKEQEKIDEYNRVKAALEQEEERQALEMQQLNADISVLEQRIAQSELFAPCDGRVAYLAQSEQAESAVGQRVRTGSLAVTLIVDELELLGDYMSEAVLARADEIVALVGGRELQVQYRPPDEEEYISQLISGTEMRTTFDFVGEVPEGVQAGDYAVILIKSNQRKDVLHLPINAVMHDEQGYYVYKQNESGARERTAVSVGVRTDIETEIVEGLQEGDVIYVQ